MPFSSDLWILSLPFFKKKNIDHTTHYWKNKNGTPRRAINISITPHQSQQWSHLAVSGTPRPCCCRPAQCRNRWSLGWKRRGLQLARRTGSKDPEREKLWPNLGIWEYSAFYTIFFSLLTMFLGLDRRKCWATCAGRRLKRILLLSSLTFSIPSLSSSAWQVRIPPISHKCKWGCVTFSPQGVSRNPTDDHC